MSYTAPSGNALAFYLSTGYSAPLGSNLELLVGYQVPTLRITGKATVEFSRAGYYDTALTCTTGASTQFIPRDQDAALGITCNSTFSGVNPDRAVAWGCAAEFSPLGGGLLSGVAGVIGSASVSFIPAITFAIPGASVSSFTASATAEATASVKGSTVAAYTAVFNKDVAARIAGVGKVSPAYVGINQSIFHSAGVGNTTVKAAVVNQSTLHTVTFSGTQFGAAKIYQSPATCTGSSVSNYMGEKVKSGACVFAGAAAASLYGNAVTISIIPTDESADYLFVKRKSNRVVCYA